MTRLSPQLEKYKDLVGEELLARIYQLADELAGVRVLHMNTTAQGGGVAELLRALLPIMDELGIPHGWSVLELDEQSSHFTARLVDLLQGISHEDLPAHAQEHLLKRLEDSAEIRQIAQQPPDVYFIHDFQLAPLARLFSWMQPAIWMCHVDTAHPDERGKAYLDQFLDLYELCVFNTPLSIFKDIPQDKVHVIMPTIDPFSEKNRPLEREAGLQMIAECGIDISRPLITQVSRFGNWKNPWQVLDIYRQVKQVLPSVQVALVGALEATDDVKAVEILNDIRKKAGNDPDIHLLSDPRLIRHPRVNAFQRYSSVVLQRSIREGFGLTVTEAMWKYQPVVGTTATGLRTQIIDGESGFLLDDTESCAQATLQLLQDRELWQTMGNQAHERVKQNYLLPITVLEYLHVLIKATSKMRLPSAI